jgi:hypothetical protein
MAVQTVSGGIQSARLIRLVEEQPGAVHAAALAR